MSDLNLRDLSPSLWLSSLFHDSELSSGEAIDAAESLYTAGATASQLLLRAASRHAEAIAATNQARTRASLAKLGQATRDLSRAPEQNLAADWSSYLQDAFQRTLLSFDVLRERGDIFLDHEAAGCPPVLTYDYELVVDGSELPRPSNYMLLRIVPPESVTVIDSKRPYIIIDPRAGHGGGIGGFKEDSQVGVALADGHPVYFVSFKRDPVPGQTLADVTWSEAAFVREVMRRHPGSPKPAVIGNCQGGWATLLLAATNPDLTGPIVLNGAPVSPWSGEVGVNPMRYNAGVLGGAWQPMFWSDMERQRFLEFERWWSGFFLLNEAEIRWIVEQLFVGNRLVHNEARLEPGRTVDIKQIRSPIIVFASHGDNITPPQQALNWIADSYADVDEIRIRGQRIVYMVHEEVGHLGIFVSSKIAKKEHSEVASTMKTIEALAPGLYEMKIEAVSGSGLERSFVVSFHERELSDVRALDDGLDDELPFAAVARTSELQAEAYDVFLRPFVKAAVNRPLATHARMMHPLRTQRALFSSRNPLMAPLQGMAASVAKQRTPAAADNPFVELEQLGADLVEQWLDMYKSLRDMAYEVAFFSFWTHPLAHWFGRSHARRRTLKDKSELRSLPEVQAALGHISDGGFVEAVIRMLVLLAESRGNVRRDRLERSARVLTQDEPFRSLSMDERARIIHEQTLIVRFEMERAVETLPNLLPDQEERALAAAVAQYVPGAIDEMAPHTLAMLQRFHDVLGLPQVTADVLEDPLQKSPRKSARAKVTKLETAAE